MRIISLVDYQRHPNRPVLLRNGEMATVLPFCVWLVEFQIKVSKQSSCDLAELSKGKLLAWTAIISGSECYKVFLILWCLRSKPSFRVEDFSIVTKVPGVALHDEWVDGENCLRQPL